MRCLVAQNFIAIAIFVADGLYNFMKIGILSLQVRPLTSICSGARLLLSLSI